VEIDRDTYDALPLERIPTKEPAEAITMSRQLVEALQHAVVSAGGNPQICGRFTNFQRDNARPMYCIP
jgi:hypothetical protein